MHTSTMVNATAPFTVIELFDSASDPQAASPAQPSQKEGLFKQLATYLNMKPYELREALQTSTLAEIAQSKGIPREALKLKLIALMEERSLHAPVPLGGGADFEQAAELFMDRQGGWPSPRSKQHKKAPGYSSRPALQI
ncbi:hypothetical protein E6C60_2318 [Paenibacillus algicola]|uniref:Uncharacterized protein n=1 Tax=Paenibacillus algicola TaxID=2565926 RepID=A0A4P8XMX7_9BACL|nr:hypothetical protein [Paenibacillus algicola]QCT03030.1 hypothetical protein E6C60_2318 [Paenibacillus algicola]